MNQDIFPSCVEFFFVSLHILRQNFAENTLQKKTGKAQDKSCNNIEEPPQRPCLNSVGTLAMFCEYFANTLQEQQQYFAHFRRIPTIARITLRFLC